jgi:hypothetical protein
MENINFEIQVPPDMSTDERNKLIRQAADTGLVIFLKQFIPFFHFRYWNTRFKIGSLVWFFLLSMISSGIASSAAENQLECREGDSSCLSTAAATYGVSALTAFTSFIVFGVYSGSASRKARERLSIDRKTALAILPAIK